MGVAEFMAIRRAQSGFRMGLRADAAGVDKLIRRAVVSAYGSLDSPNYSFVQKVAQQQPYSDLVKSLKAMGFEIYETTDTNEDVSFCYVLTSSLRWALQLSMVGRFAVFFRLDECGRPATDLTEEESNVTEEEANVLRLLKDDGVLVLGHSILSRRFPISLFNTEKNDACIYHALFSDVEVLPWPD